MSQKTYKLVVEQDTDPRDPREDDNLGTIVCFHRRYNLGDPHNYSTNDYENWEELKAAIVQNEDPGVILPLYLYDHSGITISTSPFGCRWDSGQIGWVFVSKAALRGEYSTQRLTQSILDKAKGVLEAEVKAYDQYLSGDVYSYEVIEVTKCDLGHEHEETVESCGGYYEEEEAREAGNDVLKYLQSPQSV
jgi:hypothetical protein